MIEIGSQKPLKDVITGLDAGESRAMLEKELVLHRQHLNELSQRCDPLDRARVQLEIAQTLLGLQRTKEAWSLAREIFDLFVQREAWQEAIEACEVMYHTDSELSIAALGQGVWLSVTYPVEPTLTVNMLHHIVEETPDDSDGGPVAAAMAHYIADLRGEGKQREDLLFLSAQVLAQVAKRHRGIEDEEGIKIWMEILQLNDTKELLPRMAKIIGAMVGENWWIDRDALRARLPVN
jgi:hypothetical protein